MSANRLPLDPWQTVWRDGIQVWLSTAGLQALAAALRADDPRLTQGATTTPPPLLCVQEWPVEAACAIGFVGWQGEGLRTVGEVETFFAQVSFDCDQRIGEPAACRHWINHWDDTPRHQLFAEVLAEVERTLGERASVAANKCPQCNGVLASNEDDIGCPCSACGWGEDVPAGCRVTTEEF